MSFQDASSPVMEDLIFFHDYSMMTIILISMTVLYLIMSLVNTKLTNSDSADAQEIETIWTIMPASILIMIAFPSLRILYLMDEIDNPDISMKTIGHQWFWTYEYSDFTNLDFESYMRPNEDLLLGELRLLEVNNRMITSTGATIRTLITAVDVLHSWTLPSLGVKTDAIPGRLTQTSFLTNRQGIFFGQCSEICGANHSFMPIVMEALPMKNSLNWLTLLTSNSPNQA